GSSYAFTDELAGATMAASTGVENALRFVVGKGDAGYSAKDAYRAGKQATVEADEKFAKEHPVQSTALTVGGGFLAPGMLQAGKFIAGAKSLPGLILRGGVVGAGAGGVAGAGDAEEGRRLAGAKSGAVTGGAIGAALPPAISAAVKVARPLISRVSARAAPAIEAVSKVAGPKAGPALKAEADKLRKIDPEMRAAKTLQRAIDRDKEAGIDMRPGAAPMYGGGENLVALYDVAANSPGPARELIRQSIRNHRANTPVEVEADLGASLGANGDYFAALEAMKAKRAAEVEPILQQAFAQQIDAEAFNAQIAPLIARLPKGTLATAYDLARKAGRNPEELGLANLDTFDGFATPKSAPAELIPAKDLGDLKRGVSPQASQGPSLVEFLAQNGGLSDIGGELANMDAATWHRLRPFLPKLIKDTGMAPEDAAMRAFDEGYFPDRVAPTMEGGENMHPISADDLYSAIREELSGRKRFAREPDADVLMRKGRLDGLEERLRAAGIDPRKSSPADISRDLSQYDDDLLRLNAFADGDPLPMSPNEPVPVVNPTLETLHWVKKAMDEGLEQYRNPVTRQLEFESSPAAMVDSQVRSALASQMRKINPEYKEAMKLHGDESDRIQALALGRNILSAKFDMQPERVASVVNEMSIGERDEFRKGVGEALLHKVRGGGGDIRVMRDLLRDRNLAAKVQLAFPDDESFARFLQSADRRVREADINGRIMGGSPTDPRQAARADLEDEGEEMAGVLGDAALLDVRGVGRRAAKALMKSVPRQSRSVLGDPASNTAIGISAGDAEEMTRLLNMLQRQRALDAMLTAQGSRIAPPLAESIRPQR
ncbi:MAG: hypothetical protein Q8K11_01955, partial [Phenylobacterium sp.]|uniref:hypothetical protein n=1 Tax=Phenylobacterium sp. TaxID=1871053 RepID=UPI0027319EFB